MRLRLSSPTFVGRQPQLAALRALLEQARNGDPGIALVTGEAGIGKSRLVAELERGALDDGVRVLHGDCIELGAGEYPFAPIVAALRGVEAEVAAAAGDGDGLAALAPVIPALAPEGGRASGPARLHELLLRALGRLVAGHPALLLVIEDLHWADSATRDLLLFLSRALRDQPVAVVGTYRTEALHGRRDVRRLVVELARSPRAGRLDLAPLDREEVHAQLEGILGATPRGPEADEVVARSDGNPFFVEELVAAAEGTRVGDLPETLVDVVELRLEDLAPEAAELLALVAVAGRRIGHDVLAQASALEDAALERALRELLARRLLEPDADGVRFRHALVREVVERRLLPGPRAALHAALAEALTAAGGRREGRAAELARHWRGAGRHAEALTASAEAGLEAAAGHGHAEALGHFQAALEAWDALGRDRAEERGDRAALLLRAADAAGCVGRYETALAHVRAAQALVSPEEAPVRAAELHERLGRYQFWDTPAALAAYARAEALLPAGAADELRARVLGGRALMLLGLHRHAEARDAAEAAATLAAGAGAPEVEAHARAALGLALAFLGRIGEGTAALTAARRLAERTGDPDALAQGRLYAAEALRLAGRLEQALEVTDAGTEEATRLGMRDSYGRFMAVQAVQDLFRLGRWAEAERRLEALAERDLGPTGEILRETVAGLLWLGRGDDARAAGHLEAALARCPDGVPVEFVPDVQGALAELWWVRGELGRARACVADGLAAIGDSRDVLNAPVLPALGARIEADAAERARIAGDAEAARAARRRAAEMAEALTRLGGGRPAAELPPVTLGHLRLVEAELARIDAPADPAPWRAAAAQWRALAQPALEAYAGLRLAEALAAGGRRAEARAALGSAAERARGIGAAGLEREIGGLVRSGGIGLETPPPPRAPSRAEEAGLTARECDVLRLLCAGMSNREIGERLFISSRTAGVHVSNILGKLGARNRMEAAGVAHRLALVEPETALSTTEGRGG